MSALALLVVAVLAAGACCVLYGVLVESHWYRLIRLDLPILPPDQSGTLTVLHLSDLHFVRKDARKARFIASLPQADVTVVTGDFLAEQEAVETVVPALDPVRGKLASWFVLGSNDIFVPRPINYLTYFVARSKRKRRRRPTVGRSAELVSMLKDRGWQDLDNTRQATSIDGMDIELLGLDDSHIRRHDLRLAPRQMPDRFGWAVMHSPDSAPEAVALGYDFILAGHTHGGQVRLPFWGALVTNCSMPRELIRGAFKMGRSVVHVSAGMGTSKFAPFRFWCRPSATLITLTPRRVP